MPHRHRRDGGRRRPDKDALIAALLKSTGENGSAPSDEGEPAKTQQHAGTARPQASAVIGALMPRNSAGKPTPEPLVTINQAPTFLRRFGIVRSHWTLRGDAKSGRIPCVRFGNRIYFERAALREFIARQRRETAK